MQIADELPGAVGRWHRTGIEVGILLAEPPGRGRMSSRARATAMPSFSRATAKNWCAPRAMGRLTAGSTAASRCRPAAGNVALGATDDGERAFVERDVWLITFGSPAKRERHSLSEMTTTFGTPGAPSVAEKKRPRMGREAEHGEEVRHGEAVEAGRSPLLVAVRRAGRVLRHGGEGRHRAVVEEVAGEYGAFGRSILCGRAGRGCGRGY